MLILALALAAFAGWLLSDPRATGATMPFGLLVLGLAQVAIVLSGLSAFAMVAGFATALLAGVAVRGAIHGPNGEWAPERARSSRAR